jgi:hypothetical protein
LHALALTHELHHARAFPHELPFIAKDENGDGNGVSGVVTTHLARFIAEPTFKPAVRGLGKEVKVSRYTQIRAQVVA